MQEGTASKRFWRSLEELVASPEFEARLQEEFPRHASAFECAPNRRQFLELMAASLALAGMNGCSRPPAEPIMPYVRSQPEATPGIAMHFATAMPSAYGAMGLVVTSHLGRPTKVEGNPLHPASGGATDAFAQASILTLYDPDRSQTVLRLGQISTWDAFLAAVREHLQGDPQGAGVRVLSGPINSPTLERQRAQLGERLPSARWHVYEPVNNEAAREGARIAFGEPADAVYRFADADIVVAIDADFLCRGPAAVRNARDFMSRRAGSAEGTANRLYAIESTFTSTGAAADHRLPLRPSELIRFVRALAARWQIIDAPPSSIDETHQKWINAIGEDLEQHRGRSILVAGDEQPPEIHALVLAMNQALGNIGATVQFIEAVGQSTGGVSGSLGELVQDLNAGRVGLLLILDCNPIYDAPPRLGLSNALTKSTNTVHWGLYDDETAAGCNWHIPAAHFLESWSDVRAFDGTAAIVQPLIAPLYGGRTVHELLSVLVDAAPSSSYDLVRDTWREPFGNAFESSWHQSLADGVISNSTKSARTLTYQPAAVRTLINELSAGSSLSQNEFELILRPDSSVGDGRFANNGWLQELPKPITKLTWENAAMLSPADAERLSVTTGDIVRLESESAAVSAPVCVMPGHAIGCVTCHFGYGRTRAGRTGTGLGFNAFELQTERRQGNPSRATLTKTDQTQPLARTQTHFAIDGRNIVHSVLLADFQSHAASGERLIHAHEHTSFYPEIEYEGFAWGMSIDLSKCMGCNACVVACQAENNVPIVGKEGVLRSREMHWLRMDTYFEGPADNPEAIHQPMLCQHCEKAPCEVVCPVAATTHSDEGLNEMTYNRCVGTRYCSNNCPYKVRRFNFLQYQDETTPVLKLLRNPHVTVRSRGVMEKCTYCVQRINSARIDAKKQSVDTGQSPTIADGSLQTACQQACPSRAIVFGDINDPHSQVAKQKADPRNYGVLEELNTQPRTTYLARVRNPNPNLV